MNDVSSALAQYGADVNSEGIILKPNREETSIKVVIKARRLRFESRNGDQLLFSAPASNIKQGVEKFVEGFWFWSKTQ